MNSSDVDHRTAEQPAAKNRVCGPGIRKFIFCILALLAFVLVANRVIDTWFSYQAQAALIDRMQRQQVEGAAVQIAQFIKEIENQMEWLVQLPWNSMTDDEWRLEFARLLRQVPAITVLARIDAAGLEQARVSRIAVEFSGGQVDLSLDPKFVRTMALRRYYGPVYFRSESEPYITLAVAGARKENGVVSAEINLKFIGHLIADIKIAARGIVFVVDSEGRLIAHPDISLVLRNVDLSHLDFVRSAITRPRDTTEQSPPCNNLVDKQMSVLHSPISSLGWTLFVCPSNEAMQRSTVDFCASSRVEATAT